ncbi:unnamed protein product [Adineta ricciae]|uniref:Uncharacterized protein n=1 Tax=Adineta ricciae TaxID=249248 RepID=A0A814T4W3_ADIRI|nr:unnamed protein product [Adineta ricciae]
MSTNGDTAASISMQPRRHMIGSAFVIWIDDKFDPADESCQNTLVQLQSAVPNVYVFGQRDECADFLTDISDTDAYLIISGPVGQQMIPLIHDVPHLNSIYVYHRSQNLDANDNYASNKIKGIYTEITLLCDALKMINKQCNRNDIALSFLKTNIDADSQNIDQLDPTFMYTMLLKEAILTTKYDEKAKNDFIQLWRDAYSNNTAILSHIDAFEKTYCSQKTISWYTREYFIYQMLNCSLRTLEVDVIMKMGFFICDLHRQIESLQKQQIIHYHEKTFEVFRGQGLFIVDFAKLEKNKGGLISFNNFLSTSTNRDVSLRYAEASSGSSDVVAVLFRMLIDSSKSTIAFASIREMSDFLEEEEILFSMHTVFRINEIRKLENSLLLYQVDLQLTSDDDQELRQLTEYIRQDMGSSSASGRVGQVLLRMGQLEKAEEVYTALLEQTTDEISRAHIYHQLGFMQRGQGLHKKALSFNEKALEIRRRVLPEDHPSLAITYNNIGSVCLDMSQTEKALEYYDKAHQILEKTLHPNSPMLATSYNNIGTVYSEMGNYAKAYEMYEKSLKIRQIAMPANHPDLANSYRNVGGVYYDMHNYRQALEFYYKALEIDKKVLPPSHPNLASSYNNIGAVHFDIGNAASALRCYEKALEIFEKNCSTNHLDLSATYSNIGHVHHRMGHYSQALEFYYKTLQIDEKLLSSSHPRLSQSYNAIGALYSSMADYPKALEYLLKIQEIYEKSLPLNHTSLAIFYLSIGDVYRLLGNYEKALWFQHEANKIFKNILPFDHLHMAISYCNIAAVYRDMNDNFTALDFYEKSLPILEKNAYADHSYLATCYHGIGTVHRNLANYTKALEFFEKSLRIREISLPPDHPDIAQSYHNIGFIYQTNGDSYKAIDFYEKAVKITEKCGYSHTPSSVILYQDIATAYLVVGQMVKAVHFLEKAFANIHKIFPSTDPTVTKLKNTIDHIKMML